MKNKGNEGPFLTFTTFYLYGPQNPVKLFCFFYENKLCYVVTNTLPKFIEIYRNLSINHTNLPIFPIKKYVGKLETILAPPKKCPKKPALISQ